MSILGQRQSRTNAMVHTIYVEGAYLGSGWILAYSSRYCIPGEGSEETQRGPGRGRESFGSKYCDYGLLKAAALDFEAAECSTLQTFPSNP